MKHLRLYQTPGQYLGELFASPVSQPNVSDTVSPSTKDDICSSYHKGNKCSVAANKIANRGKASARNQILYRLKLLETFYMGEGVTCEELEKLTGLSHQTCSARLSELRREGKIKIVGTRKTKSGSPASVYQAL